MARARNIKPGLYLNDELAQCSVWARYIFPGLWTLADRDGKLEDRPAKIKAALLPYDAQNVDKLLSELHNQGFIHRYSVDGRKYIAIVNFHRHQNPHCKEPASLIPDPQEGQPEQGEHCARTMQEQDRNNSGPADSLLLNPSSLIPESPIPESGADSGPVIPEPLNTDRFKTTWAKWVKHRKEIKAPLKPEQQAGQLKKLAAEGEPAACERIERSIANGWRGLWFSGDEKNGRPPPRQTRGEAELESAKRKLEGCL